MTAEIDVIILSWNRTPETIDAIKSALEQTGVRQRVLVVDQGSAADNLAQLRRFAADDARVTLKEVGRNIGVTGGRNLACDLGTAPYIVALDNDAVFADRDVLRRAVELFEAETGLGAIAFRILNFYSGHDDEMCWDYPEALRPHANQEFEVTRFIGAGHALRRRAFYDAGRYDEALFFSGEERDVSYRILNLGYRIRYMPQLAVRHKVLPGQRVRWDAGRYYYTVRNVLYSDFKFGRSAPYLMKSVAALTLRGARNGVAGQAVRGAWDAARLALGFARSTPAAAPYRLRPETRRHIRACESIGRGGLMAGIARQFQRLPGA